MALGILEPNDEHVAGTVYVYEQARSNVERLGSESNLKRDRTGKITLIPQPSDDPNDPLVWYPPSGVKRILTLTLELASLEA